MNQTNNSFIQEEINSVEQQIRNLERNLLFIKERKSEYVLETDIDIQLIRDERQIENKIVGLNSDLARLKKAAGVFRYNRLNGADLLTYDVNRSEQKAELSAALQALEQSPARPLLCLFHGDESQSHDTFYEILKEQLLAFLRSRDQWVKHIRSNFESVKVEDIKAREFQLRWPRKLKDISMIRRRLSENLAEEVMQDRNAKPEDVNQVFAAIPGPVVINTFLYTEDLGKHCAIAIDDYIEFWENWPWLSPGQRIFVCLFVVYQRKVKGFHRKFRFGRMNKKITSFLDSLTDTRSFASGNVHKAIISQLEDIKQPETEEWARSREVRNICKSADLINEIQKLYIERNREPIPMDDLARSLKEILRRCVLSKIRAEGEIA